MLLILALVQLNESERVLKSPNRVLETHTVLFVVGSGLGLIPFKVICRHSNGNQ